MNICQLMDEVHASDLMTRKIISVQPESTLAEVAGQLLDHQISGAPVVEDGRCVGVISANDLVSAEEKIESAREEFAKSGFWDSGIALPVKIYEEKLAAVRAKLAPVSQQPVRNFMTTDIVSVGPDSKLGEIVQKFVDGHVHRILVHDNQNKLVGIISTIDVLAHFLNASRKAGRA